MAASLLDNGAGELDAKAFQEQVEDNAVQLSFSVGRDYVYGSIRMLRERQEQSVNLLQLALNQPRFDADEVERTRAQILASLRRETTEPNSIASKSYKVAGIPTTYIIDKDGKVAASVWSGLRCASDG